MNSNEWEKIHNSRDSKIYNKKEWGTLLNKAYGYDLYYLEKSGDILPLAYIKSAIFGNRLISLPFADYGGPITFEKTTIDSLILKTEKVARTLEVDFIEIRSPSKIYHNSFMRRNYVRRDDYFTFIMDIEGEINTIWGTIGKNNRNMIRKAEKNGIEILEAKTENDLKIFYSLYLETMKKLGSPPHSYKFFLTIWNLFYPNNLEILFAKYDNVYIAANLFFLHQDIIHHSYNCSLKEYLGLGQNNLLLWHMIEKGNNEGFKYLDFGRTRENAGNVLFKKRWGGELVNMPYFYRFYKKELTQRPEIEYRELSKLWSKYIPSKIARYLGPHIIKEIG